VAELVTFLLPALPLLGLLAALLLGRYPGCEAIVRLSERIAAWNRPRLGPAGPGPQASPAPRIVRGGGLLLALSLSGRAPPVTA
jgi:hypothetical protein